MNVQLKIWARIIVDAQGIMEFKESERTINLFTRKLDAVLNSPGIKPMRNNMVSFFVIDVKQRVYNPDSSGICPQSCRRIGVQSMVKGFIYDIAGLLYFFCSYVAVERINIIPRMNCKCQSCGKPT